MYRIFIPKALLALALVGFTSLLHAQTQPQTKAQLPAFSFKLADTGKLITQKSLKPNMHTLVIFFDPSCDHCELQAEWIKEALSRFGNTQFLWVSTATPKEIQAFRDKFFKGVTVPMYWAQDSEYRVDEYFGYTTVPSIYVYNTQNALRVTYRNEVAVDMILAYLN
jgi:peroxiredoxin